LKNVVNPDDVIREKGCDTLRTYVMFMGPLDAEKPWDTEGITGSEKFLKRVYSHFVSEQGVLKPEIAGSQSAPQIERVLHKCLKRVDDSFQLFNFNTYVAGMMEALNHIQEAGEVMTKAQAEFFVKMLAPLAPHLASELWEKLGHSTRIDYQPWPKLDPQLLIDEDFELVVQVNGKVRAKMRVAMNIAEDKAIESAIASVPEWVSGKEIVKKIYVKNKLVNLVVKG
jgi:leucyl-tRNA synthetase